MEAGLEAGMRPTEGRALPGCQPTVDAEFPQTLGEGRDLPGYWPTVDPEFPQSVQWQEEKFAHSHDGKMAAHVPVCSVTRVLVPRDLQVI